MLPYDAAIKEFEELKAFAGKDDLKHWDTTYWAEKQKEAKFEFNAEELRPYFPLRSSFEWFVWFSQTHLWGDYYCCRRDKHPSGMKMYATSRLTTNKEKRSPTSI